MLNDIILFVISGPSGSGKTTLVKNLLQDKDLKYKLSRSISFTTRNKRPGEHEGQDYFFITEKEFKDKLKQRKILEWTKFLNYYYGTLKDKFQAFLKKKRHLLFCLDEVGAFKIKKLFPHNAITIFILPPGLASLKSRMVQPERRESQEDTERRLSLAKRQIAFSKDYDYRVVNDNLRSAVKKIKDLILKEINSRRRKR